MIWRAAEQVFQVGDGVFPPLRSVDAVPTNLPTVRTELIGRTDDVTALMELVERERLVTLTGVGGVGKTRLALGVAAALAAGFADGCWLVELSPVADGEEVLKTVAAAIPCAGDDRRRAGRLSGRPAGADRVGQLRARARRGRRSRRRDPGRPPPTCTWW